MKENTFEIQKENNQVKKIGWNNLTKASKIKQNVRQIDRLPLHPEVFEHATEFQKNVWRVCSQIPKGSVVTYKDIAMALGRTGAVRAVANALGRNPVAVKVPCHRVVGGNSIGGYSCKFGIRAKMSLLRLEGAF
ncbi:MAG: methylated-DNA--[protein]-cysteine S-methyltransferase [Candidatus Paceibacterales bacterium]